MNINFTIFVQIFHFLIAYVFLSKFLFKPILNIFRQETDKIVKLNENIATEQQKLHNQELLADQNWAACKNAFQENLPKKEVSSVITKLDTSTIQKPIKLTAQESENIVDNLTSDIKSRVIK